MTTSPVTVTSLHLRQQPRVESVNHIVTMSLRGCPEPTAHCHGNTPRWGP